MTSKKIITQVIVSTVAGVLVLLIVDKIRNAREPIF